MVNFTKYIIEMLDELVDYVNNYYILKCGLSKVISDIELILKNASTKNQFPRSN